MFAVFVFSFFFFCSLRFGFVCCPFHEQGQHCAHNSIHENFRVWLPVLIVCVRFFFFKLNVILLSAFSIRTFVRVMNGSMEDPMNGNEINQKVWGGWNWHWKWVEQRLKLIWCEKQASQLNCCWVTWLANESIVGTGGHPHTRIRTCDADDLIGESAFYF